MEVRKEKVYYVLNISELATMTSKEKGRRIESKRKQEIVFFSAFGLSTRNFHNRKCCVCCLSYQGDIKAAFLDTLSRLRGLDPLGKWMEMERFYLSLSVNSDRRGDSRIEKTQSFHFNWLGGRTWGNPCNVFSIVVILTLTRQTLTTQEKKENWFLCDSIESRRENERFSSCVDLVFPFTPLPLSAVQIVSI